METREGRLQATQIASLNVQVSFLMYFPFLSPIQDPKGWNKGNGGSRAPGSCCQPQRHSSWHEDPLLNVCVCVGGVLEGSGNYRVRVEEVISQPVLSHLMATEAFTS